MIITHWGTLPPEPPPTRFDSQPALFSMRISTRTDFVRSPQDRSTRLLGRAIIETINGFRPLHLLFNWTSLSFQRQAAEYRSIYCGRISQIRILGQTKDQHCELVALFRLDNTPTFGTIALDQVKGRWFGTHLCLAAPKQSPLALAS